MKTTESQQLITDLQELLEKSNVSAEDTCRIMRCLDWHLSNWGGRDLATVFKTLVAALKENKKTEEEKMAMVSEKKELGSTMFYGMKEAFEGEGPTPTYTVDPKDPIGREEFEMLKCEFSNIISQQNEKIRLLDAYCVNNHVSVDNAASELQSLEKRVNNLSDWSGCAVEEWSHLTVESGVHSKKITALTDVCNDLQNQLSSLKKVPNVACFVYGGGTTPVKGDDFYIIANNEGDVRLSKEEALIIAADIQKEYGEPV